MFEPLHSLNFGIGGDQTQNVLWRVQNGELDNLQPKVMYTAPPISPPILSPPPPPHQTQNILWRIQNGELDNLQPKVMLTPPPPPSPLPTKQHPLASLCFLASRDECPGSLCHSPSVRIGVSVGVRVWCVNKNFNLGLNFLTSSDRAFILHVCIPCDKTFHMVQ